MSIFISLGQPILGEKLPDQKEREKHREKKPAFNSGHCPLPATWKGSARISLGAISNQSIRVTRIKDCFIKRKFKKLTDLGNYHGPLFVVSLKVTGPLN